MQHIDAPSFKGSGFTTELWTNPPHRSHLCAGCGHIWRPADVPTEGVRAIETKGKADRPAALRRNRIMSDVVLLRTVARSASNLSEEARAQLFAISETLSQPLASAQWCNICGEGVTTFCRGKLAQGQKCPVNFGASAQEVADERTLKQRDEYHDVADDLARYISDMTGQDIGEHSSPEMIAAGYGDATCRDDLDDPDVIYARMVAAAPK